MHNSIRSAILAAALFAGFAPAYAQVPPPVPALPDTERRTSYVISATTCACAVGFQLYGDSTDVGNWIEVWINGTRIPQSGNWNLTSPTGSIATIPRPITDAVLTFTTAQTGTVQIVGARRPRRTSQFNEGVGVPTRSFNQVLSDLTAQNREVWDKINDVTGRTVMAPPGETLALLPVLASRVNKGACFDSSGNLVPCVAIPTSTFTAGNGITLTGVNPTTITNNIQAGAGIIFTGTNPIIISTPAAPPGPFVVPSDYSAVCDGVTNDAVALQNMITASVGKMIFLPAKTCVTNATLTLPSNTTIVGASWDSVIKSTVVNLPTFSATNASNVVLTNFSILGINNASGWNSASNFGALQVFVTNAAVSTISNIQFTKMKVSGFNASYWMWIGISDTSTQILQDVRFDDNYIVADATSIPGDANPAANGNHGFVFFGGTTQSMRRASFSRNKIISTGMCFPIIMFGNVSFANFDGNEIDSPGQTTPGHCVSGIGNNNAYGITVYDLYANGNTASNYSISNNIINSPYASGVYIVGNSNTSANAVINNNVITGQTSTDIATLPRGAIAINGAGNLTISNNAMSGGFAGIGIASVSANAITVSGNNCHTANGSASSFCYRQTPATGAANTEVVSLVGNTFFMNNTGTAILLVTSTTNNRFNDVHLSNNQIRIGGGQGINAGGQFFSDVLSIRDNVFTGTGTSASIASITGNVYLFGNMGLPFTAATVPAALAGSSIFVTDGTPGTACTGAGTGSTAFRQNGAWKCF